MPAYLTHQPCWETFWPLIITPFFVALLVYAICFKQSARIEIAIVALGFSSLGIVAGYLTGLSRQPAVGDLIPAVLSLIGALAVYIVGKSKNSRRMVGAVIFILSVSLLLGTIWGAVTRTETDVYLKSKEYLIQRALVEKEVQDFRKALGLDSKTPNNANAADAYVVS